MGKHTDALMVIRSDHVGASDITAISMVSGFIEQTAVIDWITCGTLSWLVWVTLVVAFCIDASHEEITVSARVKPANFSKMPSHFLATVR